MIAAIENAVKIYNGDEILKGVSATVEDRERIGLVGVNGAGKSTLLRLITGSELPDSGKIHITGGKRIGFLEQDSGLESDNTIEEEMRRIFADLLEIEERLERLREAMGLRQAAVEYARLQTIFEQREGYQIDVKIRKVLHGMGFGDKDRRTAVSTLSGGEKTRLALAKLLLEEPDLLILDEPTNHLDFKRMIWLEEFLQGYRGALLVVSHDRYFLDRTVERIWDLENGRLRSYRGNYSKYAVLKAEWLKTEMREFQREQERIAALRDYIDRNRARASTARSARGREKALARIEEKELPYVERRRPRLSFAYDREPVKAVLKVENLGLTVGAEQKVLLSGLNFSLERGEKLAVIGPNGVGKSTLLKTLKAAKDGAVRWGDQVVLAYYDQEGANLDPDRTAIDELWDRDVKQTEREVRNVLARVLLRGEDVYKRVGDLSGGERAKLSFAILATERGNVLLLDEPTNHLDLTAREALEEALAAFEGTLILVSHDRYFLNRIPTKIMAMEPSGIRIFPGNYEAYLAAAGAEKDRAQNSEAPRRENASGYKDRHRRRKEAELRAERGDLERRIAATEAVLKTCERRMADPETQRDYSRLHELCLQLEEAKRVHDELLEAWVALEDEGEEEEED